MLNSIKRLIDLCTSVRPVTPKPDGFRALDVEHLKGLNNLSQKELRSQTNHYIYLLTSFDANTQYLMRQEVRLLNEAFFFFFSFLYFNDAIIMPKSYIPQDIQIQSKTLKTTMYDLQLKIIPHKQNANVFRDFQIFQHMHSHSQR
jgi:hypothetical protein